MILSVCSSSASPISKIGHGEVTGDLMGVLDGDLWFARVGEGRKLKRD